MDRIHRIFASPGRNGHLAVLLTILIWGMTYIATKVLLTDFSPAEVLFLRFIIAYLALAIAAPRPLKTAGWRQELLFAAGGLSGVTLYFLLQNLAIDHTSASNAGVIISTAPFFTALAGRFIFRSEERMSGAAIIGVALAMTGLILSEWQGGGRKQA